MSPTVDKSVSHSYFLELTAIITLGKDLARFSGRDDIFTSVWAVYEHIQVLTEAKYQGLRGQLCQIADSGLRIDWDLPGDKEFRAYGLAPPSRKDEVRFVYDQILSSKTYSGLGDKVRESLSRFHRDRKLEDKRAAMPVNDQQPLSSSVQSVFYVAQYSDKNVMTLMSSYDRTLERYFSAKDVLNQEKGAISLNDLNDLFYFMYLPDDRTIMVSNDKLMKTLDRKFGKTMNVPEFLGVMVAQ